MITFLFWVNLLLFCGDVHPNPGPISTRELSCFFLNTQSIKTVDRLKNKPVEFRNMVELLKPDILAVNESWLQEYIPDSLITDVKKYALYRKDRIGTTGGGVFVMVSKTIWSRDRKTWESEDTRNNEIKVVEIRPTPTQRIAIITAYRSQTNPCPEFLKNLEIAITNCIANNVAEFIIMGDFNYPDLKWNKDLDKHISKNSKELLKFLEHHDLTQFNFHPSRKDEKNILDLFITNIPQERRDVHKGKFLYSSDHHLFDTTFALEIKRIIPRSREVLNYKRADFNAIKEEIRTNPEIMAPGVDVESTWSQIKTCITSATSKNVPTIKIKNKYSPAWIDNEVIHYSHKKKCAFQKWKRTKKKEDEVKYKKLRNGIKNLINRKYTDYINNTAISLTENPKRFWTLLKDRTKSKSGPTMLTSNGQEETNPQRMCQVFNTYFSSVFNNQDYLEPPVTVTNNPELADITFTKTEVEKELKNLNANKAQGPDGLSTRVLKECATILSEQVNVLFNQSMSTSTLPVEWKTANVVPIHKKGSKTEPSNYRPVSLLPIISKVMERCVLNKIIDIISPRITNLQHGFMKGKSTTTQIISVINNIQNIFDNKKPTDVIYFDLSKAFDSVPHKLLILKLKTFGINGSLLGWIEDYLKDRKQRVTMDGEHSNWLPVTSGVPQGSILGPVLFILYINDLPEILSPDTLCAIFADDTKVYRQIKDNRDQQELQEDINKIAVWGSTWGLTFNAKKTVHITIASRQTLITNYKMEGNNIEKCTSTNDLGIEVSDNLKWTGHIDKIVKKASQRLGLIIRTLGYDAPLQAKKTAYVSLVRSILETGSQIWSPTDKENILSLEKIQRKATNYILNNPYITQPGYKNYHERLLEIGLLPLTYRREIADISFLCKHLYSQTLALHEHMEEVIRATGARTRLQTQPCTYKVPRRNSIQGNQLYSTRVARLWNTLPDTLRECLKHQNNTTIVKQHLLPLYRMELANLFDPDNTCTWTHICQCPRCKRI
jgi:hypothetical protein